jgi:hypothetical protein
MAITKTQLKTIKFTQIRGSGDLIRPVGDDLMLTATGSHIYLNGMHLINTEFMDLKWLDTYLEKVIQGKRRHDNSDKAKN